MPLDEALALLLPGLRAIAETHTTAGSKAAEEAGTPVSCRKGCGACCRQLAPVLPIEVPALARALDEMTPERRAGVIARATEARRVAERAGLRADLDAVTDPETTLAFRWRVATAWFALGIDCPFLDEGACSIHAERPLSCREYLVTSDPKHCEDPAGKGVVRVVLSGSPSEAYKQAARTAGHPMPRRVLPMVDAIALAATSITSVDGTST